MYPGGEQRRASFSGFSGDFGLPQQVHSPSHATPGLHAPWTQAPMAGRNSIPNANATAAVVIPEMMSGQPTTPLSSAKMFKPVASPPLPNTNSNQQFPMSQDPTVTHQGILRKKPNVHMWTDNPWPVRYFYLKSGVLIRYKDRSLSKKTEFGLKGATIQYGGFGRDTIFRLCSPLRQWTLAAPSGLEAQAWITALQEAIKKATETA